MAVNVTYRVYTGGRWLPDVTNLSDYAGIYGSPVQGVQANLSYGTIQYRVHTINGSWLPWVNNREDYAGIYGQNIDGLQMKVIGVSGQEARYRAYAGGRWLPWVKGLEDYAGIYGLAIEAIQVEIVSSGGGGFDTAGCLAKGGNIGLFKDLGLNFSGFDVWRGMAIVGLSPAIYVEGKLSLSPPMPSRAKVKGFNLNFGTDSVATEMFDGLSTTSVNIDRKLTANGLKNTFAGLKFEMEMSKYITVGVEIQGTTAYYYVQASFTYNGTTVYQLVRITVLGYIRGEQVAVVATAGQSAQTSTKMDVVEIVSTMGMIAGTGIAITAGLMGGVGLVMTAYIMLCNWKVNY